MTDNTSNNNHVHHRLANWEGTLENQRRARNQQRLAVQNKIRKQKKSSWLAQKRGLAPPVSGDVGTANATIMEDDVNANANSHHLTEGITTFLQHATHGASLEQLQSLLLALQRQSTTTTTKTPSQWTLDDPARYQLAQQLVQRLATLLQQLCWAALQPQQQQTQQPSQKDLLLLLLQILTQLVALSPSSKTKKDNDNNYGYYGQPSTGWSDVLAEPEIASKLMPLLTNLLWQSNDSTLVHCIQQASWFVGNWVQDLPQVASRWIRPGHILFCLLLQIGHSLQTYSQSQQQQPQNHEDQSLSLIQAASWAYFQCIQGDRMTSGWDYIRPSPPSDANQQPMPAIEFSPAMVSQLLSLPCTLEKTRLDITVQTAWILVHLSQREDAVVEYLLESGRPIDMVGVILEKLSQIGQGAQQQLPEMPNYHHHPLLEPCIEVLGHWATACDGIFIPRLLSPAISSTTTTTTTTSNHRQFQLLPILEQLLKWGQEGLLQVRDYLQVLWLCGCLLCDAGIPNHPSTTLAAARLLPLLTQGLQDTMALSPNLEMKREGVLAIWNALQAPPLPLGSHKDANSPPPPQQEQHHHQQQQQQPQNILMGMLQLIYKAPSAHGSRSNNNHSPGFTAIQALKDLLVCQDVDAMLAALQVLNLMLRLIPQSRVTFQEVDGDEALETICDLPLGNGQASEEAAEIAAELMDDFFVESTNDQFADAILPPPAEGGGFVFGAPPPPSGGLIFLPDLAAPTNHAAPIPAPTASVGNHHMMTDSLPEKGVGRGRGRGRGSTTPAWAQRINESSN